MGSDESHFNVSVGSDGQSHKTVSTNHNLSDEKGEPKRNRAEALLLQYRPKARSLLGECLSPNILRTVRRTMIRFLIELLVRRTWFGQSKLCFVLKWLVMRCKLRPELAADAQQTA